MHRPGRDVGASAELVSSGRAPSPASGNPVPLKVVYVLDEIATSRAGTEQQFLLLLDRLDRRAVSPSVIIFRGSDITRSWSVPGCEVFELGLTRIGSFRGALKLVALWRQLRELRKRGAGLVHVWLNDAAIVAPPLARAAGLRVVASRRDVGFWHTPMTRRLLRISNRFVDAIVANSDTVARFVAEAEGYPVARIEVIPNGIDERRLAAPRLPIREACGLPQSARVVAIVANLNPWKRHRDLLHAAALLHGRQCPIHVAIMGTGRELANLHATAGTLGIADSVHFLGQVADPIPLLWDVDVAVLCSESEGFSNALLEYVACGCAVVATETPGNAEALLTYSQARLYPVGDINGLADAIQAQLHAQAAGPTARHRVTTPRLAGAMAADYASFYDHLLTPNAPPVAERNSDGSFRR